MPDKTQVRGQDVVLFHDTLLAITIVVKLAAS